MAASRSAPRSCPSSSPVVGTSLVPLVSPLLARRARARLAAGLARRRIGRLAGAPPHAARREPPRPPHRCCLDAIGNMISTAARPCWSAIPTTGTRGQPYLDRVVMRPLRCWQARFASLEAGESDLFGTMNSTPTIFLKAEEDVFGDAPCTVWVPGAAQSTPSTPRRPLRRRARAPCPGDGDRSARNEPSADQWFEPPGSNPYGEGSWVKCKDDGALPPT